MGCRDLPDPERQASRSVLFRFEAEVLARLHHPGIAQIYASGMHGDGDAEHPSFAMELVEDARDLLSHAREKGLTPDRRIELFL
jgi:hypothetical protein